MPHAKRILYIHTVIAMKRTAFTYFAKRDPRTGKLGRRSRYRVQADQLPKGTEAVGTLQWRDLPESDAEMENTSGFLSNRECPVPPRWSASEGLPGVNESQTANLGLTHAYGTAVALRQDQLPAGEQQCPTTRATAVARIASAST